MLHTTKEKTDQEDALEHKTAIAEQLIREKDAIIESELRRYDEAAFYIRLQSQCFTLYPVVVRLLARCIKAPRHKDIFRSIVRGEDLNSLAERLQSTPEKIGITFRDTVRELSKQTQEIITISKRYDQLQQFCEELQKELRLEKKQNRYLSTRMNHLLQNIERMEKRLRRRDDLLQVMRQNLKEAEEWRLRMLEEERTVAYWFRHQVFRMLNFQAKLTRWWR